MLDMFATLDAAKDFWLLVLPIRGYEYIDQFSGHLFSVVTEQALRRRAEIGISSTLGIDHPL